MQRQTIKTSRGSNSIARHTANQRPEGKNAATYFVIKLSIPIDIIEFMLYFLFHDFEQREVRNFHGPLTESF